MAKDKGAATTPADGGDMATVLVVTADAVGHDTFTSVDVTSTLTVHGHGNVAKAEGTMSASAIAEGSPRESLLAVAYTDIGISGADKVNVHTSTISFEQDGISYEVSVETFKAMDHAKKDGETTMKIHDKSPDLDHPGLDNPDFAIDLDGNVAIATFEAQANGHDSLVAAEATVLSVEDMLSSSAVVIVSTVG
jgi:hypothetical protein